MILVPYRLAYLTCLRFRCQASCLTKIYQDLPQFSRFSVAVVPSWVRMGGGYSQTENAASIEENPVMHRTSNTLSENIRSKSVELLNRHLAAAIDLHAQVKQAHWNVRGPTFIAIHELFDKVADAVEGHSDTIAERAAALGGTAEWTVHVAVERSFLEPYKLGVADEKSHISAVTAVLAAFGDSARKAIDESAAFGDQDTSDVFTEIWRDVDHHSGSSSRISISNRCMVAPSAMTRRSRHSPTNPVIRLPHRGCPRPVRSTGPAAPGDRAGSR
jgi:starvation-inducible DNA-binding protein